jgi:myo-inositol 2-dehydrogenase/D-chiro-inositol 1-dehydrogenase
MAPPVRRLKIAVSGLGRMGARHANHFLHRTPKAELVAAFTPAENELAWAKENLEPWGVKVYSDYDLMLKHEGLEAVCVATVTTAHAEQSIKAIEAGLHVLCEKPLSTNLDVVRTTMPYYVAPTC